MKKNNNQNQYVNSRWKSMVKPLFTFFVVAIPALLIWFFFSNDFKDILTNINMWVDVQWWGKLLISFAFIIGTTLIALLFIYLKMLDISVLTFSLPVAICFMVIFLTDTLPVWGRALIIIPVFFLIIPINIMCKKIEIKIILRNNKKNQNNEKIIGYKEK